MQVVTVLVIALFPSLSILLESYETPVHEIIGAHGLNAYVFCTLRFSPFSIFAKQGDFDIIGGTVTLTEAEVIKVDALVYLFCCVS